MVNFNLSPEMTRGIHRAIQGLCDPAKICVSIADTSYGLPQYAGHNDGMFVYPASLYKLYLAAAVINQVSEGKIALSRRMRVSRVNAVDKERQIPSDLRPLLQSGVQVRVERLLDLTITGSSNTGANMLIDLVGRDYINAFIVHYGWHGSEVTRKFLPRSLEDEPYREAKPTMTTTRHLTELLCMINRGEFPSYFLNWLSCQKDIGKIKAGLPKDATFAHKTGWYLDEKGNGKLTVVGDCGIIRFNEVDSCVVSCIVRLPDPEGSQVLTEFGKKIQGIIADVG